MSETTILSSAGVPKKPLVSIGMPVYNGAKFIREALDSLLAQTFTDFELIISDNASTDETEAICREYAAKDARIRYIRQPENRGALANFQFVLDEAVGEYFMWAAADDRRHPSALERMIEVFEQNPNAGLVFSNMCTMNLLTGEKVYGRVASASPQMKKVYKYLLRLCNGCPSLIYGLHKRSILKCINMEQYDFFDVYLTHWYELNSEVYIVPLVLYTAGTYGRRTPYSITHDWLNPDQYLERERELLLAKLGIIQGLFCYFLNWYLIKKNIRALKKTL